MFARWEERGIFHPEPEGSAEENYSIAIPPPNVTGALHMGHALNGSIQDVLHPRRAHARHAHQVDLRHRPRRHRHPAPGRAAARRGGHDQGGARPRGVRRARLGLARAVRLDASPSSSSASARRSTTRTSASRWTTTTQRAVADVFVRALREGPDLPRQLHGQLGPRACARRSPTSRSSSARSRTRSTRSTTRSSPARARSPSPPCGPRRCWRTPRSR